MFAFLENAFSLCLDFEYCWFHLFQVVPAPKEYKKCLNDIHFLELVNKRFYHFTQDEVIVTGCFKIETRMPADLYCGKVNFEHPVYRILVFSWQTSAPHIFWCINYAHLPMCFSLLYPETNNPLPPPSPRGDTSDCQFIGRSRLSTGGCQLTKRISWKSYLLIDNENDAKCECLCLWLSLTPVRLRIYRPHIWGAMPQDGGFSELSLW